MNQVTEKVEKLQKHGTKELCSICNIRMDHASMEQHLKGKKHISLSNQAQIKKRIHQQVSNEGIFIAGIPTSMRNDQLVKHFKKFGKVVAMLRNQTEQTGLLQFRTRQQADAALRCLHHVEGSLLGVVSRNSVAHLTNSSSQGSVGNFDQIEVFKRELVETLKPNTVMPIDEQIRSLVKIVEITDEEKRRKSQIVLSLKDWLSLEFPGCSLHLFGSSVSGLAFRNDSDLDIVLQNYAERLAPTDASLSEEKLAEGKREYMLQTLRRASNVIRSHPDITDMFVISHARIPVSKFVYTPEGVKCDLTCNNIIGVQNSKLLYSLQSFDVRIRPYLYALKFWAKSHRLISSPESTLSSYALTLMAVYYLQQTEPPLVPTIESLQNELPLEERLYCNGWNVSFKVPAFDTEKLPTQANPEMSIMDLLIGFFRFYQQLNANEMVVCPRIGKCLPKTEFFDSSNLSESPVTSCNEQGDSRPPLKISELSVQDPFELNFNVSFHFRHFELFQSFCELAERTCLRIVDLKQTAEHSLLALFKAPLKTKLVSKALKPPAQSSVLLKFTSLDGAGSPENAKELCQSVGQFISSLLIFSYGIRVDETPQLESKQQKMDCDLEVLVVNDSIVKWGTNYLMTAPFDVFYKRNKLTSEIQIGDNKTSLLDQERAITSLISSQYASIENVKPFAVVNFSMTCDVKFPIVGLHFGNTDIPESVFFGFVKHLRRCVRKSVNYHLIASELPYELMS